MWSYLIIVGVLLCQPSSYSTEFIYTIVDGSLSDPWRFNFTIFANDFQGVILHCFDSGNNQLGVMVTQENNNNKKSIRLRMNTNEKSVPIKQLCGCDTCDRTKVDFIIQSQQSLISVSCNNRNTESVLFTSKKEKNNDNNAYPLPAKIFNTRTRILIMIGNIGPYDSEDRAKVNPLKEQMVGCLYTFYYNNERSTFIGNTTKVRPSCSSMCNTDSCHGGLCTEISPYNLTCDCSSTALNGRYCNRSLKMYIPTVNNSLIKMNHANEIYLKMTWKQMLYEEYCLMEIVTEHRRVTISINKNNLSIDSDDISNIINMDGINFVKVNISNNNLIVKIRNKEMIKELSIDGRTQINVGFSEGNERCKTFEGAYDLHFDPSTMTQGRLIQTKVTVEPTTIKIINITHIMTHIYNVTQNIDTTKIERGKETSNIMILAIAPLIIIIAVLSFTLVFILFIRRRKDSPKTNTKSDLSESPHHYSDVDPDYVTNVPLDIYDYVPMKLVSDTEIKPVLPPRTNENIKDQLD